MNSETAFEFRETSESPTIGRLRVIYRHLTSGPREINAGASK